MIGNWIERENDNARSGYEASLENIKDHAARMAEGAAVILEKLPEADYSLLHGKVEVHPLGSARVSGGPIKEFTAIVTTGEGKSKQIFALEFSDEDYPSLNVTKGFTVNFCTNIKEYEDAFSFAAQPEIWAKVGSQTPVFREVVGVGLYGKLADLTEDKDSGDLKKCLGFLEKQFGKLP